MNFEREFLDSLLRVLWKVHPACFFINQVGEAATPECRRPEKHLPYLVNSSYFAHQLSSA